MALVLICWLALALPGYALLRRFAPRTLEGLFGGLALSYLASFSLLSPVSVTGYLFSLPIAFLGGAVLLAIAAALVWLWRNRPALPRLDWASAPTALALLLVAVELYATAMAGTHMGGDAGYHVGRIKLLMLHGFNQADPLVAGQIEYAYTTNLYHALLAAIGKLAGLVPVEAWVYSLAPAKLIVIAGAAYLAQTLAGPAWVGSLAACGAAWYLGPLSTLTYPNNVASSFFFALAAALVCRLVATRELVYALALGACALCCAQFHPLYGFYVAVLAGPTLLAALIAGRRDPAARRALGVGLLALSLAGPWVGIAALKPFAPPPAKVAAYPVPEPVPEPVAVPAPAPAPGIHKPLPFYKGFVYSADGQSAHYRIGSFTDPRGLNFQLLVIFGLGLLGARRKLFLPLFGVMLTSALILHVPPICTLFIRAFGSAWMVKRLSVLMPVVHVALMPAYLVFALRFVATRPALQATALALTAAYGWFLGVDAKPWTRERYLETARAPQVFDAMKRRREHFENLRAFIPSGATIVSAPANTYELAANCDCFVLATGKGQGRRGVPYMARRQLDAARLLAPGLDVDTRKKLLEYYGVRYVHAMRTERALPLLELYRGMAEEYLRTGRQEVVRVRLAAGRARLKRR